MKNNFLVLSCLFGVSLLGQSDPKKPAPLGPGINKGNVDNFGGAHYYYAIVGPGHFDIKMAFKEMGIFGNPLRQGLSFDFKNEKGEMLSHNAIVSQGKIEYISTTGDLPAQIKTILVITAEPAAVRKGGYYEVEITGAVHFEADRPVGGGAKPDDTRLVTGTTQLVTGTTTLVNGPVSLTSGTPVGLVSNTPVDLVSKTPVELVKSGQALVVSETPRETRVVLAADVLFDFNSAVLRADAIPELRRAAVLVRQKARGPVRIEGHTDSKGTPQANMTLSQQRGLAVQAWLVQNERFPVMAFTVQGFAASRPAAPNNKPDGSDDPVGRQKNRRVELIITK